MIIKLLTQNWTPEKLRKKHFCFFVRFLFVVIEQIMKTKYTEFLLLAALDQNVCHGKEKSSH